MRERGRTLAQLADAKMALVAVCRRSLSASERIPRTRAAAAPSLHELPRADTQPARVFALGILQQILLVEPLLHDAHRLGRVWVSERKRFIIATLCGELLGILAVGTREERLL
jgi:hypothetical protein